MRTHTNHGLCRTTPALPDTAERLRKAIRLAKRPRVIFAIADWARALLALRDPAPATGTTEGAPDEPNISNKL